MTALVTKKYVSFHMEDLEVGLLRELSQNGELVNEVANEVFKSLTVCFAAALEHNPALAPSLEKPLSITFYLGTQSNQVNDTFKKYFDRVAQICWKAEDEKHERELDNLSPQGSDGRALNEMFYSYKLDEARRAKLEARGLHDTLVEANNTFLQKIAAVLKTTAEPFARERGMLCKMVSAIWDIRDVDGITVNALEVLFWRRESPNCCFKIFNLCCCFKGNEPEAIEHKEKAIWRGANTAYNIFKTLDIGIRPHVKGYDPSSVFDDTFLHNGNFTD